MLASGNQVRGFEPDRSCGLFRAKKSSACLPSEGKYSRRAHDADLRHVKEPFVEVEFAFVGKITGHLLPIFPHFPARAFSRRCRRGGSWRRKWELPKPG
jgi:hypothetical protein